MAGITIRLPGSLRVQAGGAAELQAQADTVEQALCSLEAQAPGVSSLLRSEQGAFRAALQVYVNDQHVRLRQGMNTPLQEGDIVLVVPTVMGG